MTLKQLYEDFTADEIKEVLHNYILKEPAYKYNNSFEDYVEELCVCPICEEINEEQNMTFHLYDIGGIEQKVCLGCRNDEEL